MQLKTERLIFEPLALSHAQELFAGFSDPSLYEFIPRQPPADLTALTERFSMVIEGSRDPEEKWLNWAIRLKSTSKCIGQLEATVYSERRLAEIAYFIIHSEQGHGFAKEACLWLCDYLRNVELCTTIAADIDSLNLASMRLVESLGFKRLSLTKNADTFKGRNSDEWHFEHTIEELTP